MSTSQSSVSGGGRMSRGAVAAGVFTLLYMLAAVPGAWLSGNSEFVFYIVVMAVLIVGVIGLHLRVGLTTGALWCLAVWGGLHMAGGLVSVPEGWPINGDIRVLYSLWLIPDLFKYDHFVHAFGFGTTTWVCWQSLRAAWPGVRPTLGVLTLCAAAGMGFGAMNEVVEFIATLTVPETNVGGYINTGWDLVANLSGCVIAAVLIRCGGGR